MLFNPLLSLYFFLGHHVFKLWVGDTLWNRFRFGRLEIGLSELAFLFLNSFKLSLFVLNVLLVERERLLFLLSYGNGVHLYDFPSQGVFVL